MLKSVSARPRSRVLVLQKRRGTVLCDRRLCLRAAPRAPRALRQSTLPGALPALCGAAVRREQNEREKPRHLHRAQPHLAALGHWRHRSLGRRPVARGRQRWRRARPERRWAADPRGPPAPTV